MDKRQVARVIGACVVVGMICAAAGVRALAAPVPLDSKIEQVTVYAGRAMVARAATVQVQPGEQEFAFEALPGSLQENSVGVSGHGTAGAKILRLTVKRQYLGEPPDERVRRIEKEIERLRDQDTELQNQQNVAQAQNAFLDKIEIFSLEKLGKDIAVGEMKVEGWENLIGFFGTQRAGNLSTVEQIRIQRRELGRQISTKERELNELRGFRRTEARSVTVAVDVKRAGELTLDLRYIVPGASWEPLYDLRCERDKGKLELTYYGKVRQRTGEDWDDISLSLSTARPSLGANLPDLRPWYIVTAPARASRARAERAAGAAVAADEMAEEEVADWSAAESRSTGASVVFTVQGRETIPSTNEERRSTIIVAELDAKFTYVTVPKLQEHAFIKATSKNTIGTPLLPGSANVFHGADFVGESRLDSILPGQEFTAFVGADEFVKVERKLLIDKVKYSSWGKTAKTENSFRITVENQRGTKVNVIVRDQIPVSRTSEIIVKGFDATLRPRIDPTEENQGMIEWDLDLKPGEKKTIEFGFTIQYPVGMEETLQQLNHDMQMK